MVASCSAIGCTNRFVKNGVGFFRFPLDPVRRKLWHLALRRKNFEPSQTSTVCGEHFQTGRPSRDPNHPDYVPNVFNFKPSKKTGPKSKMEREEEKEEKRVENILNDNSVAEKNVNLETFSTYNTFQIKELSRMEEDVLNTETMLQQEYIEIRGTDIKQERELSRMEEDLLYIQTTPEQEYREVRDTDIKQESELSRMEEDVLYIETTPEQEYREVRDTDIKQESELSGMEEDVLYIETTLEQEYREVRDTDIKQESEVSEKDDELLNLKSELQQAYSEESALTAQKDGLLKEIIAAGITQSILSSSISVKEAELSELRKELQQAYTEISALRTEKEELQKKLASSDLTHTILHDPNKLHFYTGLSSVKDFHLILSLLSDVKSNVTSVSLEKQVLMVLVKLKLNLLQRDLAYRFQISTATVCKICDIIIPPLETKLDLFVTCPVNNALKKSIPVYFKNTSYENLYQRLRRHSKSKTKPSDNEETD